MVTFMYTVPSWPRICAPSGKLVCFWIRWGLQTVSADASGAVSRAVAAASVARLETNKVFMGISKLDTGPGAGTGRRVALMCAGLHWPGAGATLTRATDLSVRDGTYRSVACQEQSTEMSGGGDGQSRTGARGR